MEDIVKTLKNIQEAIELQKQEFHLTREQQKKELQLTRESITTNINEKFQTFENRYTQLEKKVQQYEALFHNLKKTERKKNIILFNLNETERGYHQLENLVLETLNSATGLNLHEIDIDSVTRLGRKSGSKNRPILIKFTTLGKKIHVLKKKRSFENTPFYIKEDYPKEVIAKRKELQTKLKEERDKGNKAILKYDKIIIIDDNRKSTKRNLSLSPDIYSDETKANQQPKKTKKFLMKKHAENTQGRKPNGNPTTNNTQMSQTILPFVSRHSESSNKNDTFQISKNTPRTEVEKL